MNRHDEIEKIVDLVTMVIMLGCSDDQLRKAVGEALDKAYQEGYRQCKEDQTEVELCRKMQE